LKVRETDMFVAEFKWSFVLARRSAVYRHIKRHFMAYKSAVYGLVVRYLFATYASTSKKTWK